MARGTRRAGAWKEVIPAADEQFTARRIALLKQAAQAFNANGYHGTSLEDVAKVLGVTKAALYYYIKNKQEILFECHQLSNDLADRAWAELHDVHGTGYERLIAFARHYVELLTGEFGAWAVLTEFDALEPANRKIIAARRAQMRKRFQKLIVDGIGDGSIRKVDPKLTTLFFLGSMNWMMRWFDPAGPLTNEQVAAQFADLIAAAVRNR